MLRAINPLFTDRQAKSIELASHFLSKTVELLGRLSDRATNLGAELVNISRDATSKTVGNQHLFG